jgi:hypothetical protein
VRWSGEAVPVTRRDVETWKDRQRAASWTQDQLPELERGWAELDVPQTRPYYGWVAAGSDGTLWVMTSHSGQRTTAFVFGADGQYDRAVEFPAQFTVLDSGPGWVLGVRRDENDVEYVELYER